MHDFCLTLPYAAVLIAGGIAGAVLKGSVMSAIMGVGIGLALFSCGWSSWSEYAENKKQMRFQSPTYAYTVISLVLSLIVTMTMADRYSTSGKMMPAGAVAGLSGAMDLFYVYKLFFSSDTGSSAQRKYGRND